jgi:hypothetical protein
MTPRSGLFIYLIGLAGTGKLTIARAIRAELDCLLVDNHLINNVVFSLVDLDGVSPVTPEVWARVQDVRTAALATVRDLSRPGRSFVFTNELLAGHPRHERWFADVREVAHSRGARLVPVRLLIDPDELARRVASPGRAEAFKDVDAAGARLRANRVSLYQPVGVACLDLDVTALSPAEAAARILAFAGAAGAI